MTIRWILTEVDTGETWQMPINPDTMTSPHQDRSIATVPGGVRVGGMARRRSFLAKPQSKEWTWSGVIRSKEHYDAYVAWAEKPGSIFVADHLGRCFEVFIRSFEPEERTPTATTPWRFRFTVKTLLIRQVY